MTLRLFTALTLLMFVAACGSHSTWQDDPQTHIVRKGETLFSIAWRYGKNTQDIARWNRLGNGSLIYPGLVLRLNGSAASGRSSSSSTPSASRPAPRPLPSIPSQPAPKWSWPTQGRINVGFGAKPGTGTGVLINGKGGQSIKAAAPGRVVYAGSGLIGYGKLIIIKHNDTYLSAYGYNASLLVKEGDEIKKGQKIATMGEGPERKPRLHFEIRRNGKPVNPRQYLSAR
jgi:lipoprotein NlpD